MTVHRRPWLWLGAAITTAAVLLALWLALAPAPAPHASGRPGSPRAEAATPLPAAATEVASSAPAEDTVSVPTEPVEQVSTSLSPVQPPAATPIPAAARGRAQVTAERASVLVSEGTHAAVVLLHRHGNLTPTVQIAWRLSSGSARLREDFDGPDTGTTRFLAGQETRAIYIPLIDDTIAEADESFSLELSSRSAVIGPTSVVTITIVDDD